MKVKPLKLWLRRKKLEKEKMLIMTIEELDCSFIQLFETRGYRKLSTKSSTNKSYRND